MLHTYSQLRERQRRPREALRYAQQTIDLARELGLPNPQAGGLQQLGDLHERKGHPRLADRSYRQAIEVLRDAGLTERVREVTQAHRRLRAERRRTQPGSA